MPPTRTRTHTHTHPHVHLRARTHARTPARTHPHVHTHTYTPTRTPARTHTSNPPPPPHLTHAHTRTHTPPARTHTCLSSCLLTCRVHAMHSKAGAWRLYAADMSMNCGLNSWQRNSVISMASAPAVDGYVGALEGGLLLSPTTRTRSCVCGQTCTGSFATVFCQDSLFPLHVIVLV